MSEIVKTNQINATEIYKYVTEIVKPNYVEYLLKDINTRIRFTGFDSVNKKENKIRRRVRIHKHSENFTDSIRDESYLIGLIKVLKEYNKHYKNLELTLNDLIKIIKKFNLEFHHLNKNSLDNSYKNLTLVGERLHKALELNNPKVLKKLVYGGN